MNISQSKQGQLNPMFGVAPWNKGLTRYTNATVQRMALERTGKPFQCKHRKGYTTSWKGKHHSVETKRKLSIAAMRRLTTEEGQNNSLKSMQKAHEILANMARNHIHPSQSLERREALRELNHKMLANNTHAFQNPTVRLKAHDSLCRKQHGLTWIEQKIGWLLKQLNIEAEAQKPIRWSVDRNGVQHYIFLDWFLPKHNLAIECDGEHWHTNSAREEKRDSLIKSCGYNIIHLRETEIMSNLNECKNRILGAIGAIGAIVVESVEP